MAGLVGAIEHVEPMPAGRVVDQLEWQVGGQRDGRELLDRRVQPRPVLPGSDREQRRDRRRVSPQQIQGRGATRNGP